jgi:hypothetical protein
MKRVLAAMSMSLVGLTIASWNVSASTVTDPKSLVLRVADIGGSYSAAGSYGKRSATNKPVFKHGLVREYQRFFASRKNGQRIAFAGSIAAAFKSTSGAKWTMSYLPKKVAKSAGKYFIVKPTSAPKFGQQSIALRLAGSSSKSNFTGLVIAIRSGRYDGIVMTVGFKKHLRKADAYRLASRQAHYLAKGK